MITFKEAHALNQKAVDMLSDLHHNGRMVRALATDHKTLAEKAIIDAQSRIWAAAMLSAIEAENAAREACDHDYEEEIREGERYDVIRNVCQKCFCGMRQIVMKDGTVVTGSRP